MLNSLRVDFELITAETGNVQAAQGEKTLARVTWITTNDPAVKLTSLVAKTPLNNHHCWYESGKNVTKVKFSLFRWLPSVYYSNRTPKEMLGKSSYFLPYYSLWRPTQPPALALALALRAEKSYIMKVIIRDVGLNVLMDLQGDYSSSTKVKAVSWNPQSLSSLNSISEYTGNLQLWKLRGKSYTEFFNNDATRPGIAAFSARREGHLMNLGAEIIFQ